MADGLLGKCKECTKKDVQTNYSDKIDYYREYDRNRAMLPHRVEARKKYAATHPEVLKRIRDRWIANNPEKEKERSRKYAAKYPERYLAHNATSNAIRDGKLTPQPCQECGNENVEAHHEDYSKRLEVVWLCKKHHAEADKTRRERERNQCSTKLESACA
jgi:hypothetical protein